MFHANPNNNSTVKWLIQLDKFPFSEDYKLDIFACKLNETTKKKIIFELRESLAPSTSIQFQVVQYDKVKAFIVGSYVQINKVKEKLVSSGWSSLVIN